jgi:hypothetical protein
VTLSSAAAAEKLWWRALASKARKALRWTGSFIAVKFFFQCLTLYLICPLSA